MKIQGGTKSKITKNESGENVAYLGITEVVLSHSNIANNSYQVMWSIIRYFMQ